MLATAAAGNSGHAWFRVQPTHALVSEPTTASAVESGESAGDLPDPGNGSGLPGGKTVTAPLPSAAMVAVQLHPLGATSFIRP